MKCAACAQALTGNTAEFRAGCNGCAARAVVQSDEMTAWLDARKELRDLIAATMPGLKAEEAWREVMVWLAIDRQAQGVTQ